MKKNYIYIVLSFVLILISSFFIKNDEKTFVVEGIKYAVSVNGAAWDEFPEKGSYDIEIECSNADASWNYQEWVAEIYNITGNVGCNISFTSKTKVTFNNYIENLYTNNVASGSTSVLSESTTGNGSTLELITDNGEEDYRYRGINPANYVMFNNELWRIIGVFDSNTHGISDTNLVKIIRNDAIGGYVWDNDTTNSDYGDNNWPDSDMYQILNTAYYNAIDGTGEDYCYAYETSLTGKCDFTKIGIQDEYRSMVETGVTWYLGGYSSTSATSSTFYGYERSGSYIYGDNDSTLVSTASNPSPIGLMYVSDYGYAAPSTCTSNIGGYSTSGCANQDWLKSNDYEWTITHRSSHSYYVFYQYLSGFLNYTNAYNGYASRPVLYLSSSVYYLSGTGTQSDPYIIAMD